MTQDSCPRCWRKLNEAVALSRAAAHEETPPRVDDTLQIVMQQILQRFANEYAPLPLSTYVPVETFETVLDVECGAGSWMFDIARRHRHLTFHGMDRNPALIDHARLMASYRTHDDLFFSVEDIHRIAPLPPDASGFHLVHARFLKERTSWKQWIHLFKTLLSLCKVGGSVMVTEHNYPTTTSENFNSWFNVLENAILMKGGTQKIPRDLTRLARLCKWGNVRSVVQPIDISFGTEAHEVLALHIEPLFALSEPLLYSRGMKEQQKRNDLMHKLFLDISMPEFQGVWSWTTVVGTREV